MFEHVRCKHLLNIVIIESICYAGEHRTQYPESCNEYSVNACWEIEPEYSTVGDLKGKSDDKTRINPLVKVIKPPIYIVRYAPMFLDIYLRAKHVLNQSMRYSE
jgi:hypothetical protein